MRRGGRGPGTCEEGGEGDLVHVRRGGDLVHMRRGGEGIWYM